ncbi:MAG: hypothetical protein D6741_06335 [Planctomycetota bacterium]|nr:MAG: hypothetical protein D6741_06335 [Planctomycetota bacterium]
MRKFLFTGACFGAWCAAVLTLGPMLPASRVVARADEPTVYAVWEENGEYRWEPIYPSAAETADKANEQEATADSTEAYEQAGSDLGYDPYEYDPYLYEAYDEDGWYTDDVVDEVTEASDTFQSSLESYSEYYDEFGQPYEDYWYRNYTGITGDVPSADFFVVESEASSQDDWTDAVDDGWYAADHEEGVGYEYDMDAAYDAYDAYDGEYEADMDASYDDYDEADEYYRYDEGYGYDGYYSGVYDESMDDYEYGEYPYDEGTDDAGNDASWWTGDDADDAGDAVETPSSDVNDADESWDYPYYYGCRWDEDEPEPGSEEAAHEGVDVDYGMQRADGLTAAEIQPQVGGDFTDGEDSEWYYEESWYYDDSQDEQAYESDDGEYGFEDAYGESYTYEYEAYEPAESEDASDEVETYSDYWYDEYEYYDDMDDSYDDYQEEAEVSSFTRMRSFPADPDVSPMGNERDYEAEVAAEWMASEYASSESADWQDWEYVYEETPVTDDTSWRVFDTPLEGEPGEPTATYAIDEMDDIAGECFRQDTASDIDDAYDEYEEYEYADPYDYYGEDYEDGYLGDEGAEIEYDNPWETASVIDETTSVDAVSSNLLAAWAPGQLLTPEDQDFLGVLESLAEESSGVRRAELSRYLDQVGLDALDLAARFEERTGIDTLGLADDIPGVAAFLGIVRLIEMGDIDVEEGITLLRENLSHMPLEWIEGATSTAADHYPRDIPVDTQSRLMPTLGKLLFQAGVSLAVSVEASLRQSGEQFLGAAEEMTSKLRAAADIRTFLR